MDDMVEIITYTITVMVPKENLEYVNESGAYNYLRKYGTSDMETAIRDTIDELQPMRKAGVIATVTV